jgi:hypothetical protein
MNSISLSPTALMVIVLAAAVVVVGLVIIMRKRKTDQLKKHFGEEYDQVLKDKGDSRHAEAVLAEREKRVGTFEIRALPEADREKYSADWADVQRHFVDDPSMAVIEADGLVTRLMTAKGYPMADFEQRAADLSVGHSNVVSSYRSARATVVRQAAGESTTEDLRQAMVHYRVLFEELLGPVRTEIKGEIRERVAS